LLAAGLTQYLDKLKFNLVGYGLHHLYRQQRPVARSIGAAIKDNNLLAVAV